MPPNPPPVVASGMYPPHPTYANTCNPSMTCDYVLTPAGYPMAQPMMEPTGGFLKDHLTSYRMEMSKALTYIDMKIADPMNPYSIPATSLPSAETPTFGFVPPVILNLKAPHTDFATLQNLGGIQSSIEPCTPSPGYDSVLGKHILYSKRASRELLMRALSTWMNILCKMECGLIRHQWTRD
ncbi:hypothetical protein N7456_007071 [Penicillium angulare]|uniref:Uncharacterized protein n=1 Tax=Penicillium angulare TaxID=116970 RepID=A0A9W9FIY3_9EURO|nr:hypothetical protein N7456_007071 [Penicillium angulare]